MPPFAVIFDMDGVLVDSYHAHYESWKHLYGELGVEYSEEDFPELKKMSEREDAAT